MVRKTRYELVQSLHRPQCGPVGPGVQLHEQTVHGRRHLKDGRLVIAWWNKDCEHHIAKRRGFTRAAFKNRPDVIGARKKHGVAIAPKSHRVPGGYGL